PAGGGRAAGGGLREHLPRGGLPVPRPLQLRPRHGEALLRPLRPARRPHHPLRHLQHLLPRRRDRSGGVEEGSGGVSESGPDPVQKFFGAALMAVGALIALLCGACTLLVVGVTLVSMFSNPSNLVLMLPVVS